MLRNLFASVLYHLVIALRVRSEVLFRLSTKEDLALLIKAGKGYLIPEGWLNSFNKSKSVDVNDLPLPWMTYSFIDFFKSRSVSANSLFEYGSGNSTLFFEKFTSKVEAIEHNEDWFRLVEKKISDQSRLRLVPLDNAFTYAKSIHFSGDSFDIIIVDGEERVKCIKESEKALAEGGVIILDDSERLEYQKGIDFLLQKGFKCLEFWGLAPGINYKKCTSVYYRDFNCLDI